MSRSNAFLGMLAKHVTRRLDNWGSDSSYDKAEQGEEAGIFEGANVVTSQVAGAPSLHRIMLDIDFEAHLIPSSTEGHYHLYLDRMLSWDEYKKVLDVLGEVGILQPGYVAASKKKGATYLRLPWVKKADTMPKAKPMPELPF